MFRGGVLLANRHCFASARKAVQKSNDIRLPMEIKGSPPPEWKRNHGMISVGVILIVLGISPGGDVGPRHPHLWLVSSIVMFAGGIVLVALGYKGVHVFRRKRKT